jgi:hypothetical protein
VSDVPPADLVPGLTNPKALGLERFLIRLREGSTTQSAWRLSVTCDEGQGAIIAVEIPPEVVFYRGDGIFLGWPQARMEVAYKALLPSSDAGGFDMQQLG